MKQGRDDFNPSRPAFLKRQKESMKGKSKLAATPPWQYTASRVLLRSSCVSSERNQPTVSKIRKIIFER
jgi:hypothetical protein